MLFKQQRHTKVKQSEQKLYSTSHELGLIMSNSASVEVETHTSRLLRLKPANRLLIRVRIYANIKQMGSEVFGTRQIISGARIHFIGSEYLSAAQIQTNKPYIIGAGSYVKLCSVSIKT